MEIILAEHSGYCFGVKAAVKIAEDTLKCKNRIYSYGPLIHNEKVVNDFIEKGMIPVDSIDELKTNDTVIVRSHGVSEQFYLKAKEKGIEVIDATCPFVRKIQNKVKRGHEKGHNIIIVGDKNHPEVIGINGWCENKGIIINSALEAQKVNVENAYVVAQTTINQSLWEEITAILKEEISDIICDNTICSATEERQKSCIEIAKICGKMIIIGGKNSSNTNKLFEISKKYCGNTFFIEGKEDLLLNLFSECDKIGIVAGASTPEHIIKEVISIMNALFSENNQENLMHQYMDEIDKSLKLPSRGEIIAGEVIHVDAKEVIVNLGCKKDGVLPKDEITFTDETDLLKLFKVGDTIDVKILKTDDGDGNLLLSRKKLEASEHWEEINAAIDNKTIVNAKVVKEVKGGVIAVYKEVSGFIPLSQLSDRFVDSVVEYIGKVLPVRVTQVNQKRNKAVFSHKAYLQEIRSQKLEEIWATMNVGDIVEGSVMRFTDYGAFIDIGGIDGLLHISEISWGKLKHPKEILKIGETVKVKILSMNKEKEKISLGLKQTIPEPWENIDEIYRVGEVVSGRIVQIKEYGAFVELKPGMDGLVHISEIAHKHVTAPSAELKIGQIVDAKILEIDKEKKRISLSIKETLDVPERIGDNEMENDKHYSDIEVVSSEHVSTEREEHEAIEKLVESDEIEPHTYPSPKQREHDVDEYAGV